VRMVLHTLDGTLDLRRLHRYGHAKLPGAMTPHTILHQDLAHPQWSEHGDVALTGQIRGQARDTLLQLVHLRDQGDGEDEVDEHHQHDNDAESGKPWRSFHRHVRLLLPRCARRSLTALQDVGWSVAATLRGLAGCGLASRTQTVPRQ